MILVYPPHCGVRFIEDDHGNTGKPHLCRQPVSKSSVKGKVTVGGECAASLYRALAQIRKSHPLWADELGRLPSKWVHALDRRINSRTQG